VTRRAESDSGQWPEREGQMLFQSSERVAGRAPCNRVDLSQQQENDPESGERERRLGPKSAGVQQNRNTNHHKDYRSNVRTARPRKALKNPERHARQGKPGCALRDHLALPENVRRHALPSFLLSLLFDKS
jgi:hypothetical protein